MNDGPPGPDPGWAYFFDADGTLMEIAPRPRDARVGRRVIAALGALHDVTGGAVALVSGRRIEDLDRLFAPLKLPCAGLHGLERRDASGRMARVSARDPALWAIRDELTEFVRRHPGAIVEDKEASLALHFRRAPKAATEAAQLVGALIARHAGRFFAQRGKMVLEIRPPGADKGTVVGEFLAERPFAGRLPTFVGDDATDETGFAAVNALGGHSIRIGAAAASGATWRLSGVKALLDWLDSRDRTMQSGSGGEVK